MGKFVLKGYIYEQACSAFDSFFFLLFTSTFHSNMNFGSKLWLLVFIL